MYGANFETGTFPSVRVKEIPAGASLEQMMHQCVSEDTWFRTMLDVNVSAPSLPKPETRLEFIRRYAEDSGRLAALREKSDDCWEETGTFFDVQRPRTWIMTRRIAHTAHHRGQQMAMLRMLGRDLHSNYGPTADTGGSWPTTLLRSMPIRDSRR